MENHTFGTVTYNKLGFVGEFVYFMYFMRDSVSRSAQETFWKKFLGNLQKLLKIIGFSYVIIHFSPTARAQSVRDQTVLITSSAHSPKSITLNRRSLLALPLSRAQTLACAAFSLRDMTEDKLGFNGVFNYSTYGRGAACCSRKRTVGINKITVIK